jgi:hypothetical protein
MSIVLPKSYLYQFLFALCVCVPYLNVYELTFPIWTLAAVVTVSQSYSTEILKQVACYVAIITIALVVMFFHDYKSYYVIRDITYISKPIIGLLLGYQLCKRNFDQAFQTIIYTGAFIAIVHLLVIVHAMIFRDATSVNMIRLRCGYFSDFEVYALIVLLFRNRFNITMTRQRARWLIVLVGFSSFMYLSRTNFIQFVILFVAMCGFLKINRSSLVVIALITGLTIVSYSAILAYNPKRNGPGIEAFLYKIKVAPIEPFKTKIDRENWRDFNDNYRSYENISTIKQVSRKGTPTMLFGEGIGSKIDLKQKIVLGDMLLRYISILHNGFMTVFLKSGLTGVVILVFSILLFFRNKKSKVPVVNQINLLLVGTGLFMFVSCWVFMGFYFIADTKSLFLGFLICYKAMAEQKSYLATLHD